MSMRRLVDESPDALERSLLGAGQDLDVPQAPKARLLAGLAAGTALTAVAANLIFYITLSGGIPRYHIRALMLVGIIALAGWDTWLRRRAQRSPATERAYS